MSGNDGAFCSCLFVVIMAGCSFSLAGCVVGEMEITIQCVCVYFTNLHLVNFLTINQQIVFENSCSSVCVLVHLEK